MTGGWNRETEMRKLRQADDVLNSTVTERNTVLTKLYMKKLTF